VKTYLLVTSIAFALLAFMHVWRVVAESSALMRDPWFVLITVISAALSVWAFRLWRQAPRSA
jgi:hypothetical protein